MSKARKARKAQPIPTPAPAYHVLARRVGNSTIVTLPSELCNQLGVMPGDQLLLEYISEHSSLGDVVITVLTPRR